MAQQARYFFGITITFSKDYCLLSTAIFMMFKVSVFPAIFLRMCLLNKLYHRGMMVFTTNTTSHLQVWHAPCTQASTVTYIRRIILQ